MSKEDAERGRKTGNIRAEDEDLSRMRAELEELYKGFSQVNFDDLPQIDLYMDQVTTYLSSHLQALTRRPDSDKILTKTMINNYAKAGILIAPEKKKYTPDHMMLLLIIYFYKNFLSINDVAEVLQPLKDACFTEEQQTGRQPRKSQGKSGNGKKLALEDVFAILEKSVTEQLEQSRLDIEKQIAESEKAVTPENLQSDAGTDTEMLRKFDCLCRIAADIYCKKLYIEKVLDEETQH
ncbi:MAG: DUF1836 domain-containing protein [Lachnospiraceae bacterium]|nr:DUF1836 domain-containing protein [Lachnospiraceae bacterium]